MATMTLNLNPRQAWQPISTRDWTAAHARHLFRRASWAALPEQVDDSLRVGPFSTVKRMFGKIPAMPTPEKVAEIGREQQNQYRRARAASLTPEERRQLQREIRQRGVAAYQEMTVEWLQFAADPENAPYEKWVTFLQNIFVVSFDRVRNPNWLFRHHDLLRQHGAGSYRDLCRAVSRSTAMIIYLDLQQSQLSAPNENFARELFELFMLGEGNYTEQDIKEAARAFTGYRHRDREFQLVRNQQDRGSKTIFGRTGQWTGDDVIRLSLEEKAAATFLPAELCRFYLTDQKLPRAHLEALGQIWRKSDFNLETLLNRFFTSRLFYQEQFRGKLIKSPLHFHLGLVQDLQLTVPPFPRHSSRPLARLRFHPDPRPQIFAGGVHLTGGHEISQPLARLRPFWTRLPFTTRSRAEGQHQLGARSRHYQGR